MGTVAREILRMVAEVLRELLLMDGVHRVGVMAVLAGVQGGDCSSTLLWSGIKGSSIWHAAYPAEHPLFQVG